MLNAISEASFHVPSAKVNLVTAYPKSQEQEVSKTGSPFSGELVRGEDGELKHRESEDGGSSFSCQSPECVFSLLAF